MDFASLHSAVNEVRKHNGQSCKHDRPDGAAEPLRSRYPAFRWRLIPAVYCAFHSALFFGGRTYQLVTGASSTATFAWIAADYLIAIFLGVAVIAWMRNHWIIAIMLMLAAIVTQPLLGFV